MPCVPRWLHERVTDDALRRILAAIAPLAEPLLGDILYVSCEAALAEPGWRGRAAERLEQSPSNEGTIAPLPRSQR